MNQDFNELDVRREKLKKLKEETVAYKDRFEKEQSISEAKVSEDGTPVAICGRIVARRGLGKFIFLDLYDIEGKIQVSLSVNELGEEHDKIKQSIDVGDFIGIKGEIYTTKMGEKTVRTKEATILSKSLRPLPEKFHGVTDTDTKYRQRYLDVISNEDSRETFKTRLKVLSEIRNYLTKNNFVEVETPILQSVACGANARPFKTHHNALDEEVFLRIAPELYLKEVIECGFDRVFELGKNFRNEGMDASHMQEFTMLEWYASYWDYKDNMKFLEDMLKHIISKVKGSLKIDYQDIELDFSKFEKVDYIYAISSLLNKNILDFTNTEELKKLFSDNKMFTEEEIRKITSVSSAIDLIFKKRVRPQLIQPTITYNYPAYMVPLARRNDVDDRIIDMFQLVVNGWEIVKCYSELVDPEIQRAAFEEQMKNKLAGDDEAMEIDEDFILAMEHGMPPMSGLGLGVDRFVSILANRPTLRDVVLFPQMKKTKKL